LNLQQGNRIRGAGGAVQRISSEGLEVQSMTPQPVFDTLKAKFQRNIRGFCNHHRPVRRESTEKGDFTVGTKRKTVKGGRVCGEGRKFNLVINLTREREPVRRGISQEARVIHCTVARSKIEQGVERSARSPRKTRSRKRRERNCVGKSQNRKKKHRKRGDLSPHVR